MILSASNSSRARWLAGFGSLQNPVPFPSLISYKESIPLHIKNFKLTEK